MPHDQSESGWALRQHHPGRTAALAVVALLSLLSCDARATHPSEIWVQVRTVLMDYADAGAALVLGDHAHAWVAYTNAGAWAERKLAVPPTTPWYRPVSEAYDLGMSMLEQSPALTGKRTRQQRDQQIVLAELGTLLDRAWEAQVAGSNEQAWLYYEVIVRASDMVLARCERDSTPAIMSEWLRDEANSAQSEMGMGRGMPTAFSPLGSPQAPPSLVRIVRESAAAQLSRLEAMVPAVDTAVGRASVSRRPTGDVVQVAVAPVIAVSPAKGAPEHAFDGVAPMVPETSGAIPLGRKGGAASPRPAVVEADAAAIDSLMDRALSGSLRTAVSRAMSPVGPEGNGRVSEDGIVMGEVADASPVRSISALEACLQLLRERPETDRDGMIVTRALALWSEGAGDSVRETRLRESLEEARPGLLGLFMYRLYVLQKRDADAMHLVERLLDDPGRYFPSGATARAVAQDCFPRLLHAGSFASAGHALTVLEPYNVQGLGPMWIQLAERLREAGDDDRFRKTLDQFLSLHPESAHAVKARELLGQERREESIESLRERARIVPSLHLELGDTLRRLGRMGEARESYALYARRFNDARADMRRVMTYWDEGDARAWLDQLRGHAERFPRDPLHEALEIGDALRRLGRMGEARESYALYARRFDDANADMRRIMTYCDEGNVATWLAELELHATRYPHHVPAEAVVALVAWKLGMPAMLSRPAPRLAAGRSEGTVPSSMAQRIDEGIDRVRRHLDKSGVGSATVEYSFDVPGERLPLLPGHREFAFYEDFETPIPAWDFAPRWCPRPSAPLEHGGTPGRSVVSMGALHGNGGCGAASLELAAPEALGRKITIGGREDVAVYFSVRPGSDGSMGIGFHGGVATNEPKYFSAHQEAVGQCTNVAAFLQCSGTKGFLTWGVTHEKDVPVPQAEPSEAAGIWASTEVAFDGPFDYALLFASSAGGGTTVSAYQRFSGSAWSRIGPPVQAPCVLASPGLWVAVRSGRVGVGAVGVSLASAGASGR